MISLLNTLKLNSKNDNLDGRVVQFLWYLIAKFALISPPDSKPDEIAKNTLIVFKNSEVAKVFRVTPQYARKLISNSCLVLQSINLHICDFTPNMDIVYINITPIESRVNVRFGYSGVRLNKQFAYYLAHSYIPYLPVEILSISPKLNPNSLSFAIKLISNYNSHYKTPQQNIISAESLLSVACEIPKYEDLIENANARPSYRIIKPFVRDLNKLKEVGLITDWWFVWKRLGKKVNLNFKRITYEYLLKFDVHYKVVP